MGILDGKAAIVTGGGRGIGRGHCLHLGRNGAKVLVNDVDPDEAKKVVGEIEAAGGSAVVNDSDIGSRKGAQELVAHCADAFGSVDAVVNNAGVVRDRSFLKMSDDEFDLVMKIHAYGTFWCAQEAALRMKEQGRGGAIVNTVSGALFGNFGQTNYAGAKGAIASMTFTWAFELVRYGIRVNAIAPMGTTRMTGEAKRPDGKPVAEIDPTLNGPLVSYLCSDEANYITGQIFGCGGDRLLIMEHPDYGLGMYKPGGWSVADIQEHLREKLGAALEPVGLMQTKYHFLEHPVVPNKD